MKKKTVLLLFGGESSEHEVSINSAKNVANAIDQEKYELLLCYITKDGLWKLVDRVSYDPNGSNLMPVLGKSCFATDDGQNIDVNVLLPVLHGAYGEDGAVQGIARLLHIPCVGPSLLGAAVTMNKDMTKRLLRDAEIPVVDWVAWHASAAQPDYSTVCSQLGNILFVKPANAGSSVGVSRVENESEYKDALDLAAQHDNLVLIESAVESGREIELAVLGNDNVKVSTPGEIVPGADFYSYEDKYDASSNARAIIPAGLSEPMSDALMSMALRAYQVCGGWGMARVDFLISNAGDVFLNEINSIPGFTDISMFPKLMEYDGMTQAKLVEELIDLALETR